MVRFFGYLISQVLVQVLREFLAGKVLSHREGDTGHTIKRVLTT